MMNRVASKLANKTKKIVRLVLHSLKNERHKKKVKTTTQKREKLINHYVFYTRI